jgi:hypothetical protein
MRTPKMPKQPAAPAAPPPPPTIDEAARNSEQADIARRRRGRLANRYAANMRKERLG